MGRAVVCPLCRKPHIAVEKLRYVTDVWANVPLLAVEEILALRCTNCRHVRLMRHNGEDLTQRTLRRN